MKATLKNLTGLACMFLLVGSISACSTTVAPEDDGTTEYLIQQTNNDQVLSKSTDESGTGANTEED